MFGFKRSKSDVIRENRVKGRAFEDQQDAHHKMMGRKIEKLPKGPDRKITETDGFTGKKKVWYEEYKSSSTAPLRPSQKEFQRKHPRKLKIIRPTTFGFNDSPKKSKRKNASKSKDGGFNIENIYGSGRNNVWGGF